MATLKENKIIWSFQVKCFILVKKKGKKLGLAGMITGIVGVAMCLLIYTFLVIILVLQNGDLF